MTITNFSNQNVNSEVDVTAWYFRPQPQSRRLKSFPKRMTWGGREYNFVEDGLRYLVQKLVQLFDMSDGQATYRLKQDGNHWTLVGIRGGTA
jgi:hypothetical protein